MGSMMQKKREEKRRHEERRINGHEEPHSYLYKERRATSRRKNELRTQMGRGK